VINMQFVLGLLTAVVFFICLAGALYIGYRLGKKRPEPKPIDDEIKRKQEQATKHFQALFSYDTDKALQRKKVT
jgi:hypothetical protein